MTEPTFHCQTKGIHTAEVQVDGVTIYIKLRKLGARWQYELTVGGVIWGLDECRTKDEAKWEALGSCGFVSRAINKRAAKAN